MTVKLFDIGPEVRAIESAAKNAFWHAAHAPNATRDMWKDLVDLVAKEKQIEAAILGTNGMFTANDIALLVPGDNYSPILQRLVKEGRVERFGRTRATQYRFVDRHRLAALALDVMLYDGAPQTEVRMAAKKKATAKKKRAAATTAASTSNGKRPGRPPKKASVIDAILTANPNLSASEVREKAKEQRTKVSLPTIYKNATWKSLHPNGAPRGRRAASSKTGSANASRSSNGVQSDFTRCVKKLGVAKARELLEIIAAYENA